MTAPTPRRCSPLGTARARTGRLTPGPAVTDPRSSTPLCGSRAGARPSDGLYRPGCTCAGWTYKDLVRPDSPEVQVPFVSWTDEHFLPLHQGSGSV